jgi:hypothetical protein
MPILGCSELKQSWVSLHDDWIKISKASDLKNHAVKLRDYGHGLQARNAWVPCNGFFMIKNRWNLFRLAITEFTAISTSIRTSSSLSGWLPKDSAHNNAVAVELMRRDVIRRQVNALLNTYANSDACLISKWNFNRKNLKSLLCDPIPL